MKNSKKTNDNQRFYPLRDPENPFKVILTPITEEQYRSLYPDIWAIQKREQYHGRCMCTKHYLWKCDGQCDLCEYHASDTVSLDEPLPDGNGTLGDYIPDSKPSIEDIIADRALLKCLIARFRDLIRKPTVLSRCVSTTRRFQTVRSLRRSDVRSVPLPIR